MEFPGKAAPENSLLGAPPHPLKLENSEG